MIEEFARRIGAPAGVLGAILPRPPEPGPEKIPILAPSSEGAPIGSAAGLRGASGVRRFVVPAFDLPLSTLIGIAGGYQSSAVSWTGSFRGSVPGGTLALDDALALVVHQIIGAEVDKPDMLAALELKLTPARHLLAALPFERSGSAERCAVTGLEVPEGPA